MRQRGWTFRENEKVNPCHKDRQDSLVYLVEVMDEKKDLKFSSKKFVATKVEGRNLCSLDILQSIYKDFKTKKWLDVVNETFLAVEQDRTRRGVPEKPVTKKHEDYVREHREKVFEEEFKEGLIKNSPLNNPTIEAPKLPFQKQQLIAPQHVQHGVVDLTLD